jgi:hypothetical protein
MVMAVVLVVAENKVVVEVAEVLAKQGVDREVDGVDVLWGGVVGLGVALDVVDSMVE